MAKLLEVKGLKKYFNTPKGMLHAVDNINFTLDQGKTLGIVGESGCGKSTLAECFFTCWNRRREAYGLTGKISRIRTAI